ncbi:hypothetical protein M3212_11665 [Alkalihalobacillus oceani]|uniref:ABC transporter substrate-binding protein n=1 Tax=Halalkalibacter oceani TaxID=1653776 RepID=UPI00203F6D85|nr:glycine betaine ABC transporter substrate-binding protein [Halalkalibacter oceani]MCM3761441.1 hypothetical protein [Halalkalibacter oceani]
MKKETVVTFCLCMVMLGACSFHQESLKEEIVYSHDLPTITVGSKSLTEQYLLMKMSAMLLRDMGYNVKEIQFLDSPSIRQAIEENKIDLYWEYTNTARMYYHKLPPIYDADEIFQAVKVADEKENILWLNRSDFNSSWGIIVKKSFAEQHQLTSISDLIEYMNKYDPKLTFASNEEFLFREDGLDYLQKVYQLNLTENQLLPVDSSLLTLAVQEGRVGVTIGMVSDSRISEYELTVLNDDKRAFPPYHAAPVVWKKRIEADPKIEKVLNRLAETISHEEMINLNYQVEVLHQEVPIVAKTFLMEKGLLK